MIHNWIILHFYECSVYSTVLTIEIANILRHRKNEQKELKNLFKMQISCLKFGFSFFRYGYI